MLKSVLLPNQTCPEDVGYSHRVDSPGTYNFCPVEDGNADALVFASVAIVVLCIAPPKWSTLVVLLSGIVYELFAFYFNLAHVSNAVVLWLGLRPADIFVYIFLPPLLMDSALRIDFFTLKKVSLPVVLMAFVMVLLSVLAFIPFMLYALNLQDVSQGGWSATEAALFAAMIASTDAASVISILKSAGAPEILGVLLEGEGLFNDASSLTLFEVFSEVLAAASRPSGSQHHNGTSSGVEHHMSTSEEVRVIARDLTWFTFGGACVGIAFGIAMQLTLRWLQARSMPAALEVALTLPGAYMSYYLSQVTAGASGCIATVVYGLYGNASRWWGMSNEVLRRDVLLTFWDVAVAALNGLIFFFTGAAATNFTIRASSFLYSVSEDPDNPYLTPRSGDSLGYWIANTILAKLPAIYFYSFGLRFLLVWGSIALLKLLRLGKAVQDLGWRQALFIAMAGLRGSLSLVMIQSIVASTYQEGKQSIVRAEIALWTTGFVLMTLLINAPLLGPLLNLLGLTTATQEQLAARRQVKSALLRFTSAQLARAAQAGDDVAQGADWGRVQQLTDPTQALKALLPEKPQQRKWREFFRLWCCDTWLSCCVWCFAARGTDRAQRALAGQDLIGGKESTDHVPSAESGIWTKSTVAVQEVQMGPPLNVNGSASVHAAAAGAPAPAIAAALRGGVVQAPGVAILMQAPGAHAAPAEQHDAHVEQHAPNADSRSAFASIAAAAAAAAAVLPLHEMAARAGTTLLPRGVDPALLNEATLLSLLKAQEAELVQLLADEPRQSEECPFLHSASEDDPPGSAVAVDATKENATSMSAHNNANAHADRDGGRPAGGDDNQSGAGSQMARAGSLRTHGSSSTGASVGLSRVRSMGLASGRLIGEELGRRRSRALPKRPTASSSSGQAYDEAHAEAPVEAAADPLVKDAECTVPSTVCEQDEPQLSQALGKQAAAGIGALVVAEQLQAHAVAQTPTLGMLINIRSSPALAPLVRAEADLVMESTDENISRQVEGGKQAADIDSSQQVYASAASRHVAKSVPAQTNSTIRPTAVHVQLSPYVLALPGQQTHASLQRQQSEPLQPGVTSQDAGHAATGSGAPGGGRLERMTRGIERRSQALGIMGPAPAARNTRPLSPLDSLSSGPMAPATALSGGPQVVLPQGPARPLPQLRKARLQQPEHGSKEHHSGADGSMHGVPADTTSGSLHGHGAHQSSQHAHGHSHGHGAAHVHVHPHAYMYGEAAGQMPQSAGPASTAADMHAGRARGQPHANMPYGHNMDVSELRLRLLTGLRAQFQARRKQGIITGPAYDVLNYACKQGLHEYRAPLRIWKDARREMTGWAVRAVAQLNYRVRCRRLQATHGHALLRMLLMPLLTPLVWILSWYLDHVMMTGVEVAVELCLVLLPGSEQMRWLQFAGAPGRLLLREAGAGLELVWAWLAQRRLEAPDKFTNILTYRAALQLLGAQREFVEEMEQSGMLEENEAHALTEWCQHRLQRLERRGARVLYHPPTVRYVLKHAPAFWGVDEGAMLWLCANARLANPRPGQKLVSTYSQAMVNASNKLPTVLSKNVNKSMAALASGSHGGPTSAAGTKAAASHPVLTKGSVGGKALQRMTRAFGGGGRGEVQQKPMPRAPPMFIVITGLVRCVTRPALQLTNAAACAWPMRGTALQGPVTLASPGSCANRPAISVDGPQAGKVSGAVGVQVRGSGVGHDRQEEEEEVIKDDEDVLEELLGAGCMVNVLAAVLGFQVPGVTLHTATAEGSSLGSGPITLKVPGSTVQAAFALVRSMPTLQATQPALSASVPLARCLLKAASLELFDAMRARTEAQLVNALLAALRWHLQTPLLSSGSPSNSGMAAPALGSAVQAAVRSLLGVDLSEAGSWVAALCSRPALILACVEVTDGTEGSDVILKGKAGSRDAGGGHDNVNGQPAVAADNAEPAAAAAAAAAAGGADSDMEVTEWLCQALALRSADGADCLRAGLLALDSSGAGAARMVLLAEGQTWEQSCSMALLGGAMEPVVKGALFEAPEEDPQQHPAKQDGAGAGAGSRTDPGVSASEPRVSVHRLHERPHPFAQQAPALLMWLPDVIEAHLLPPPRGPGAAVAAAAGSSTQWRAVGEQGATLLVWDSSSTMSQ